MNVALPRPRLRPMVAAGMAFALTVALAVRSTAADVAEHIPADALVVFKVNNLQRVNGEAAALIREFGLAEQDPNMADPLATLQRESGIRQGLNLGGNMAVYLANGNLEGEEPPLVILVPVSDFNAFVGNFKDRKDEGGGISRVRMDSAREAGGGDEGAEGGEQGGQDGMGDDAQPEGDDAENGDFAYVMQMGEYAAISPMKELLKKPAQAIQFAGATGSRVNERDIVVYANFKQLGPMLSKTLQEEGAREQGKQEMLKEMEGDENAKRFVPVAEAAFDQFFNVVESFLRDADAAVINLDLSDAGVGFGVVAQFKQGSYLANTFGKLKAGDGSLLGGLPDGNYIAFGGGTDNQALNAQLFNDLLGPVLEKLQGMEGAEQLGEYVDAVRTQATAVGETRFGWLAPSGPLGGSSMLQTFSIQGGDVEKLMAAQRKAAQLQPQVMQGLLGAQAEEMGMDMSMQLTEGAKTVAGVSFDRLAPSPDAAQAQGMEQLKMFFGPEGLTTYVGKVDQRLVSFMGLTDQQATALVESVRGNREAFTNNQPLQAVNQNLPKSRSAVFYLAPDELVRSGLGLARQMGFNMPIELPQDLPPIGMAFGPAQNAIQTDVFVSKDLISAMIVATLQAQQQFGGGGEDDDGL